MTRALIRQTGRTGPAAGRYSTGMSTLLFRLSRVALPFAGACAAIFATATSALAQVATADLAQRPSPPVPKSPEQLMAGHGVLMIILGVIFLGLVVGACLIPVKRGHMD